MPGGVRVNFNDLVGKQTNFYGVDMNEFKLDNTVWAAIENPSDGYRSFLDSIVVTASTGLFFPHPLARVIVQRYPTDIAGESRETHFDGYYLIDAADGHIWLIFGTDSYDNYYPCFRFVYTPKAGEG